MLYTVYLPKKQNEILNKRKVNIVLQRYNIITKHQNSIIASPGYMSTTDSTIRVFLQEFSKIMNDPNVNINNYYGLFNGMNGSNILNNGSSIIDMHYRLMPNYRFDRLIIKSKKTTDHRKVLCLFTLKEDKIPVEITKENYNYFLANLDVNAVLVGSSNQSKSTYFAPKALKGEADIFMFDGDNVAYKDLIEDEDKKYGSLFEDTVVSESIYGLGKDNPREFLKNILRDLLETNLV